tara:strand:- start:27128 stop:28141 length:1014 start_codon:yes stop_codon:yes gene_type:complete
MQLTVSASTAFAFYDLAASPVTLDFTAFMVCANAFRTARKLNSLHVFIVPNVGDGFRAYSERDILYDANIKHWRVKNLLLPVCDLIPACTAVTIAPDRERGISEWKLAATQEGHVFPEAYHPIDNPIGFYRYGLVPLFASAGHDVQPFQAPDFAIDIARKWLDSRCAGKIPVSITLRNNDFHPERNSDLNQWEKFLDQIDCSSYQPIIMRDSDTADRLLPATFEALPNFDQGLFNIPMRTALYESCALNLCVTSGTSTLGFYNKSVSILQFKIFNPKVPTCTEEFLNANGVYIGQQWAFFSDTQRFEWCDDTAEAISTAFHSCIGSATVKYRNRRSQ